MDSHPNDSMHSPCWTCGPPDLCQRLYYCGRTVSSPLWVAVALKILRCCFKLRILQGCENEHAESNVVIMKESLQPHIGTNGDQTTLAYPDRKRAACTLAGSGRFSMAGLPGRLGTLSNSRSAPSPPNPPSGAPNLVAWAHILPGWPCIC